MSVFSSLHCEHLKVGAGIVPGELPLPKRKPYRYPKSFPSPKCITGVLRRVPSSSVTSDYVTSVYVTSDTHRTMVDLGPGALSDNLPNGPTVRPSRMMV